MSAAMLPMAIAGRAQHRMGQGRYFDGAEGSSNQP